MEQSLMYLENTWLVGEWLFLVSIGMTLGVLYLNLLISHQKIKLLFCIFPEMFGLEGT